MLHRWKDNVCTRCGLQRRRQRWRQLMAIVNHPPWEAYATGTAWAYKTIVSNLPAWSFKRPDCKAPSDLLTPHKKQNEKATC